MCRDASGLLSRNSTRTRRFADPRSVILPRSSDVTSETETRNTSSHKSSGIRCYAFRGARRVYGLDSSDWNQQIKKRRGLRANWKMWKICSRMHVSYGKKINKLNDEGFRRRLFAAGTILIVRISFKRNKTRFVLYRERICRHGYHFAAEQHYCTEAKTSVIIWSAHGA